jgi:hypothetical protein
MKTCAALLSLVLAASVVSTANAAKHTRHHRVAHVAHVAHPATASSTDWPGNPYMDLKQSQVEKFWRDAFDPFDATAK